MRPLMVPASEYDCASLLEFWRWRVPSTATPLFLSALGDWVFGAPDGSLWALSMLEGDYSKVAANAAEYNGLNKSEEWLDQTFCAGWLALAIEEGLVPTKDECLGWRRHPRMGGEFAVRNLHVVSMRAYQCVMGQMHQALG